MLLLVTASACGSSEDTGGALGDDVVVACELSSSQPEDNAGPTPLRRDITEGQPGAPLQLRLQVVDAEGCAPASGLTVAVWHPGPNGGYTSAFRGSQRTNAAGLVTFRTVVAGWEPGRAAHVHVRVLDGSEVLHTAQLFLPEPAMDAVATTSPYNGNPQPLARHTADPAFTGAGGAPAVLPVSTPAKDGSRSANAVLSIRVRRS